MPERNHIGASGRRQKREGVGEAPGRTHRQWLPTTGCDFAASCTRKSVTYWTEPTFGRSGLGLADALDLQHEPRSIACGPVEVRNNAVGSIAEACEDIRGDRLEPTTLLLLLRLTLFRRLLRLLCLLRHCCPPSHDLMAVSEQCLRESQALHPDYYRTNKKNTVPP